MSGYHGFLAGSDSKKSAYNAGTWVGSLGWEDPLEKGVAIHSSILAWRISWTEEPGRLLFMGSQRVGHNRVTNTFTFKNYPERLTNSESITWK